MPGLAGRGKGRPHAIPRSPSPAAYPLAPIPSTHNPHDQPGGVSGQQMSLLPNDRSTRSTPAHSPLKQGRSLPHHPSYIPLPTDVPTNPDNPVSEQAAELIHEFVHPHHLREDPFGEEEEPDEPGGNTPVIAEELKEMRSRVWWRRPSALWYALVSAHTHVAYCNPRSRVTFRGINF